MMGHPRTMPVSLQLLTTSGQVRTLSLISFLLGVFISYQAATVVTVDTFIWLNFHHISSPISVVVTFLKRGGLVAAVSCVISLLADVVLLLTSAISVYRCLGNEQATDCPVRLVQHSWIALFAAQHVVISLLEVFTMFSYDALLAAELEKFEKTLEQAEDAAAQKLLVTEAKKEKYRISAGVERRLSIFSITPAIFYWVFVGPTNYGVLCTVAGMRPLRDAYGIWCSYRIERGVNTTQGEFFDTTTTVLSAIFLLTSLLAWLWCEQFDTLLSDFSAEILYDAVTAGLNDPWGFFAGSLNTVMSTRPESFLLLFTFVEICCLANKNSATRL